MMKMLRNVSLALGAGLAVGAVADVLPQPGSVKARVEAKVEQV